MASFKDHSYAANFRDLITRIAKRVVNEERPDVRMGKVFSFDQSTHFARVLFAGETVDNLVKVRVAQNMEPTKVMETQWESLKYQAEGDIVRVWGRPGNYFILDYYAGVPSSTGPAAGGEPTIAPGTAGQYWRGDKSWQSLAWSAISGLVSSLPFEQLNAPPATPGGGSNKIYFKQDGLPYYIGSDGVEQPFRNPQIALHANPDFEEWLNGKPTAWVSYWRDTAAIPATWEIDAADKVSGNRSFKITVPPNGTGRFQTLPISAQPGQLATFEIWAKATGAGASAYIAMLTKKDADPSFFDSDSIFQNQNIPLTSTWRKITVSFKIPSDHNRFIFDIHPYTPTVGITVVAWFDASFSSLETTAGSATEPGIMEMWPLAVAPSGYLLCNGAVYNVEDYPILGKLLLGKFPGGNGTTTFAVPDLRGRFPFGVGTFAPIGANEGAAEASRSPRHRHASGAATATGTEQTAASGSTKANLAGYNALNNHGHTPMEQPVSGADAIPYLGVNFIIKT